MARSSLKRATEEDFPSIVVADDFGPYEFNTDFLKLHSDRFISEVEIRFNWSISQAQKLLLLREADFYESVYGFEHASSAVIGLIEEYKKEIFINDKPKLSRSDKIRMLDRFTHDNPGKPVSSYVMELFGDELLSDGKNTPFSEIPAVPQFAEKFWKTDRLSGESPADFIMRNYGVWAKNGLLSRGYINKIDPALYMAVYRWEKDDNRVIPPGFHLLHKIDEIARDAQQIDDATIKHAQRVLSQRQRQRQKDTEK